MVYSRFRICSHKITRFMSHRTNQNHSLIIVIIILCLSLITINYSADPREINYFTSLKSQLDQLGYRFHLKSVRICCLILTTPENFLTRTQAVHQTWGPRCDRYFFISEHFENNMTSEQIQFAKQIPIAPINNIRSGRPHLTEKTTLAFLFAYENYFHDFDWFVKADDDTFLIVENLRRFLREQDSTEPVTFGYNYKVFVPGGYQSGGASYVLSREALHRFYEAHQIPNNTFCQEKYGIEDVEIATCFRQHGIYMGKSLDEHNRELFHPLAFQRHFSGLFPDWIKGRTENPLQAHYNCCSDRTISFHYMTPVELFYLDFLLYKMKIN